MLAVEARNLRVEAMSQVRRILALPFKIVGIACLIAACVITFESSTDTFSAWLKREFL